MNEGPLNDNQEPSVFKDIWIMATAAWVICWGFVIIYSDLPKELNQWGDFMAGVFAPLAFFWLLRGYRQQSKELRLSRQALLMQAEELRNSVQQQKALVELSREEFEHTVNTTKTEYSHRRLKAQPEISLTKWVHDTANEESRYIVQLKNSGGALRAVKIELQVKQTFPEGSQNDIKLMHSEHIRWDTDKLVALEFIGKDVHECLLNSISLTINSIDSLEENSTITVMLQYLDGEITAHSFNHADTRLFAKHVKGIDC